MSVTVWRFRKIGRSYDHDTALARNDAGVVVSSTSAAFQSLGTGLASGFNPSAEAIPAKNFQRIVFGKALAQTRLLQSATR